MRILELVRKAIDVINALIEHWEEPKVAYGLTQSQIDIILAGARRSEQGYAHVMELALSGYGLRMREFDQLLADHGIGRR